MQEIIKFLSDNGIDFVLVGGLAVALHGYARNTMDVDIVMAMDDHNVQRFLHAARSAGLRPVLPVEIDVLSDPALLNQWHRERHLLAFGLHSQDSQSTVLDILIKPVVSFASLRQDAKEIALGTQRIAIASIDHLIEMKSATGRSKDAIDVEELQKIKARQEHPCP